MKKIKKLKILKKLLLIFFLIIAIFLGYAHYEYTDLQVKNIVIESSEIPEEFDGKKILFLADFQVDTIGRFNKKQLQRIINLVNKQQKDVILIGGDFVNWTGKIEKFYKEMENLKAPKYGIYTVLGNHDYADLTRTEEHLKKLGYKLLSNKNEKITINNESIFISGVDDLWHGKPNAKLALNGIKKEDFTIFLAHNPEYFEKMSNEEKNKTDIILSGHTHGGQVTFFGKVFKAPVKNIKKYGYSGLKEYENHKMYITSGVGGSALEMFIRFFAKPEIVIFELRKLQT